MITVLGSAGFIGSHLANRLRESGIEHYCPARNEDNIIVNPLVDSDLLNISKLMGESSLLAVKRI
jgi:nucleoside-diphosphate-sugar epimerase